MMANHCVDVQDQGVDKIPSWESSFYRSAGKALLSKGTGTAG
jgi:hypothetical protein